jgi:hypothetical protein
VYHRGWEQAHQPVWIKDAIRAREKLEGGQGKRCPPGGFFPLTLSPTSSADRQEGQEDATAMVSPLFQGLRFIEGDNRGAGWNHQMETLTVVSHSDQIWSNVKNHKDEIDRTFLISNVASDLPSQDTARLVLSEMQDRGTSVVRMTHSYPSRPAPGQEAGPTTITVVLSSFGVRQAALLFHRNERFQRYSWHNQGLVCKEPRPAYQKSTRMSVPPDWTMGQLWDSALKVTQLAEREEIRKKCGLLPHQTWGRLHTIPADTKLNCLGRY